MRKDRRSGWDETIPESVNKKQKKSRFDALPNACLEVARQLEQKISREKKPTGSGAADGESTTLWMGDIQRWEDEDTIKQIFESLTPGCVCHVKIAKDKDTGLPLGFGFIDCYSTEMGETVLETCKTLCKPGGNRKFKLSWAQGKMGVARGDFCMHVANVDKRASDDELLEFFRRWYRTTCHAKVAVDASGSSRGFGFVRFRDDTDFRRALLEMNGMPFKRRQLKVSEAFRRDEPVAETFWTPAPEELSLGGVVHPYQFSWPLVAAASRGVEVFDDDVMAPES